MGKQAIGISQIRKYLNGELDGPAMHRLERQAQDDPFLMDALEGYQNTRADQQANLDELASRLNKRLAEKKPRIVSFGLIGIAASILVICGAGLWLLEQKPKVTELPSKMKGSVASVTASSQLSVQKSAKQTEIAIVTTASKKQGHYLIKTEKPAAPAANISPLVGGKELTLPVVRADTKTANLTEPDTTPLNEMIVMNYTSSKKKDTGKFMRLNGARIKMTTDTAHEQQLQAYVPGAKVYPDNRSAADINKLAARGGLGNIGVSRLMTNSMIQGKVIAENNGLPIQGASVKVSGTNQLTKTDAQGYFMLHADSSHTNLVITNRGYRTREVNAATSSRDSIKTITLAPDNRDELSEVVVTGFTSQPRDANETYIAAHPGKGWGDYRKYLKINAVSPDGAAGVVKLTFKVDKYGSVLDIKVVKGLSDAANKKAISLVKDGPDWVGNSNKKPEQLNLRIKFYKQAQ
jgi:cytoskeletal protein RodZ